MQCSALSQFQQNTLQDFDVIWSWEYTVKVLVSIHMQYSSIKSKCWLSQYSEQAMGWTARELKLLSLHEQSLLFSTAFRPAPATPLPHTQGSSSPGGWLSGQTSEPHHHHLVPRLTMCVVIPPFSCVIILWYSTRKTTLSFTLLLRGANQQRKTYLETVYLASVCLLVQST